MRLAIWCTSYFSSFGGVENVVHDLLNRFAARGIQTSLIAGKSAGFGTHDPGKARLDPRVLVYNNRFRNPFDDLRRPHVFVMKLVQYFMAAIQVGFYLRQAKIELVHLHFVSFDVVLLILYKYLLGYKLIVTFAGSDVHLARKTHLASFKVRLALRHADCATAVSEDLRASLLLDFGARDVVYVPNGIDRAELQKCSAACSAPVDPDHLIYCGRLAAVKRVPFLIAAFAESVKRGCDRKLYIIGDGEEASQIRAVVAACGLSHQIILLGALPHEQVLSAIGRSRCVVLSSANEGCPMVVLESFALGRPVIAPCIGGLKDILIDGVNGYAYPVDRQDLLSDSIMKIARDKTLADSLGSAGSRFLHPAFDLAAVTDRYCRIYDSLFPSRRFACV